MRGAVSFPHAWAGPRSERPRQQSPEAVLCLLRAPRGRRMLWYIHLRVCSLVQHGQLAGDTSPPWSEGQSVVLLRVYYWVKA